MVPGFSLAPSCCESASTKVPEARHQNRHGFMFFLSDSANSTRKLFSMMRGMLSSSHCRSIGRSRSTTTSSNDLTGDIIAWMAAGGGVATCVDATGIGGDATGAGTKGTGRNGGGDATAAGVTAAGGDGVTGAATG